MSLHNIIIKISEIFTNFIPHKNIIVENDANKIISKEPTRDYYEDLGNLH